MVVEYFLNAQILALGLNEQADLFQQALHDELHRPTRVPVIVLGTVIGKVHHPHRPVALLSLCSVT